MSQRCHESMDFIEYDYDSQKDLKKKKHVEKQ